MGTYSDINHSLPFLTRSDMEEAKSINTATADALMDKFGEGYVGILYGGFMCTENGVKLIEYNARFGDPEALNILSLLDSDFVEICNGIANGTLNNVDVRFQNMATVCKYAVPEGYPNKPLKGRTINLSGIRDLDRVFYGSVDFRNGVLVEAGSRTIAVVGIANTIFEAEKIAENEISSIEGPLFHRSDIGTKKFLNRKIKHIDSIR